jgi:hypothetical protein
MFRKFALCLVVAGSASAGLAVTANAQSTTRIETRPFYGAVVTLEQGVRVYRALPPERNVIINPDGTPISLGFNEAHVYEQSQNYNYNYGPGVEFAPNGIYGTPFIDGRGLGKRHGRFGHGSHHRQRGYQLP